MTRKARMWAKAAGDYYRKNKGKNGIESFSDVLKSDVFKKEYYAKYGKQGKTVSKKGSKLNKSKKMGGEVGAPEEEAIEAKEVGAVEEEEVDTEEKAASVDTEEKAASVDTEEKAASAAPVGGSAEIKKMGGKRKGKGKKRTAKKMSYKMW